MGGSGWVCFHEKDEKSFYHDSFSGQTDKFSIQQLPKPITHLDYKIQNKTSGIIGSSCLYFF